MMPLVGFLRDRRRTRAEYHYCDRAGSPGARFRAALPAGEGKRRWAARRRRRLPALLVLVRHLPEFAWAQKEEAHELFERLLTLQNDLGLISEEYDPCDKRLLGNFSCSIYSRLLIVAAQFWKRRNDANPAIPRISPMI